MMAVPIRIAGLRQGWCSTNLNWREASFEFEMMESYRMQEDSILSPV